MDALEAWLMRLVQMLFTAVLGRSDLHPTPEQVRAALMRAGMPPQEEPPSGIVQRAMSRFWEALDSRQDGGLGIKRRLAFLEVENREQARELAKLRSQTRATLRTKLDHFGELAMEAVKDPNHPDIQSCIRLHAALQGALVVSRLQETQERLALTEETLRRTENARAAWHEVAKRFQEHGPQTLLVGSAYDDRDIRLILTKEGNLRVELLGQQRTPQDAVQVKVDDWLELSLMDMGLTMENGGHTLAVQKRSDHLPESW